jgi:L-ribulokinase
MVCVYVTAKEGNMGDGHDLVLGLDFGTDSVRVLLVDAMVGKELAGAVVEYPRWAAGKYCDPQANRFRQHPLDYLESMEKALRETLASIPGAAGRVRGMGIDTTGSTPALADDRGMPLALTKGFEEEPDAMFILWKDHTSIREAADINELARSWGGIDYSRFSGGVYSSEWFWSKVLHVLRTNGKVGASARTIIEHCDWIPALLTGNTALAGLRRSRCAAGHKALWHEAWGGYPSQDFLGRLHRDLPALAASLGRATFTSDAPAGTLSPEWAERLGLPSTVAVAVGAFDAHMGAVGGGVRPGTFLRIMGTSTCDIMVGPKPAKPGDEKPIRGICGQVDGSVIPGFTGYEAGQSAYGDLFAWWKQVLSFPLRSADRGDPARARILEELEAGIMARIDAEAKALPAGGRAAAPVGRGVLALDWMNGRRTPDADQALAGALTGLSLGTTAADIYRALVEAAAFGARSIVERFRDEGIVIENVAAIGGVAKKSAFVMQTLADVLGMDISVSRSDQSCALGAAMFAAAAAGIHQDLLSAQKAMAPPAETVYVADAGRRAIYDRLYGEYLRLAAFEEKAAHPIRTKGA